MLDMFTKRWYVPAHCKNEKQVPKTLQKFGINYDRFLVVDETTKETVGYVFRFKSDFEQMIDIETRDILRVSLFFFA